jgi:hypothetical protein
VASNSRITAEAWENTIRPALRGMARAVYAPAGFVDSTDTTLVLSVPNAIHRSKCEEQRAVVESALAAHVGSPVTVELREGSGGGDDGGGGGGGGGGQADGGGRGGGRGANERRPPGGAAGSIDGDPGRGSAVGGGGDAEPEHPDASDATAGSSPRERGLAAARAAGGPDGTVDDHRTISAVDLPDDDDVDLDDLVDAPPDSVKSPIDRLAEAFPGSELIEEAG